MDKIINVLFHRTVGLDVQAAERQHEGNVPKGKGNKHQAFDYRKQGRTVHRSEVIKSKRSLNF